MARIFLSYDRDDAAKARTLAKALEGAGHAVWWDSHIKGGTEYSREIEQALNDADAVVVLWSRDAVNSPWVRDEAAAGRDRGRLVPIRLDETDPPMGFRQYQNINLSAWRGRGKPSGLEEILACIDRLAGELPELPAKVTPAPARGRSELPRPLRLSLIAAFILAAIAATYFLVNRGGRPSAPVVAVMAADNGPSSRSLADDLFIKLGSLQAINADALQLVEKDSSEEPDLTFRVAQKAVDGRAQATVALLAGGNGGLLWSRQFRQEQQPEADLRQQVAYSAALALACATEAMAPGHRKLNDETLKLYLGGCARISGETMEQPQPFAEIFRKVTQQAPDFAGGWAKLLIMETEVVVESGMRDPAMRKSLQMHIRQARKINPTMAEAYYAEVWMMNLRDINGWMPLSEAAVTKNPFNTVALSAHSADMSLVGRLQQSVDYARRAVQADPLSPSVRTSLIGALARAGEVEAAKDALKEAELLWPGASSLIDMRFTLMARHGDPREALAMLRSGKVQRKFVSPAMESLLEARIDPSAARVDRAVQEARAVSKRYPGNYSDTLAEFRRKDELITFLFEYDPGAGFGLVQVFDARYGFLHNDARFMAIMKKWGSQFDYWRKSGNWPDFCFKPGIRYDCKAEAAKLARSAG